MGLFGLGSKHRPPAKGAGTRLTPAAGTHGAQAARTGGIAAALPGAAGPSATHDGVDEQPDVAVSELNLDDDDFSSIFGSQPSQFSDTALGPDSLDADPWSSRLRLD
jgi:hypothetical protein